MRNVLFIFGLVFLSGCLSPTGSHVVTGSARPSITPEAVKIIPRAPEKVDPLGIVNATVYGESQKTQDHAISLLKQEAAKMGANTIVIFPPTHGDAGAGTLAGFPVYYHGDAYYLAN